MFRSSDEDAGALRAGDYVYLSGTVYTARDAAHKRMQEAIAAKQELPFSMEHNVIYYMGLRRQKRGRRSDLPDLLQPAEWTDMRPRSWIWD